MKRTLIIWAAAVLLLAVGSAKADLSNGSFEDGLNSWSIVLSGGDVQAVSSHTDSTGSATGTSSWSPTDGSYFALLEGGNANESVQLYQTFTASSGDTLTFDYFWDSEDYDPYDDTGMGTLLLGSGTGGYVLSTLFSHSIMGSDPEDYWGTPWTLVSYTFAASGTYTLLIETWNDLDSDQSSYVGIDNVALTPVPVPGAILLGMLGLGAAGLKLRKFA